MKKLIILTLLFSHVLVSLAQSYDQDRKVLANFIERMYNNAPFEGCRIIDDYDNSYFLSVVALDKGRYKTEQIMNRVAEVKSQRNAGEFFNGSESYSEITIKTPRCEETNRTSNDLTEVYEVIKSNSIGYVKMMQLLTTFVSNNGMNVFVYAKLVDKNNINQ